VPTGILPTNYYRTEAFESDLSFYLGADWKKDYVPRQSVCDYLRHLEKIKQQKPILMLAYVYHMYMGLLSGGQILGKKRQLSKYFSAAADSNAGAAVTNFDDDTIAVLKQQMRSKTDAMAEKFDDTTKELLLQESIKVFELNNDLVRSVKGASQIVWRQIGVVLLVLLTIYLFFKLWKT
jgi:heme oxygenase 2